MSSVGIGRPFEEEQQLEKMRQGEGCRSEEEAKGRKMGDEAEDAFDSSAEVLDEDMDEGEVIQAKSGEGSSSEEVDQPEKKRPGEAEGRRLKRIVERPFEFPDRGPETEWDELLQLCPLDSYADWLLQEFDADEYGRQQLLLLESAFGMDEAEVSQAKAKMPSVEEGRSCEEIEQPEKMGDEAEDAFDSPDEDEEMEEAEVEQPEKKRPGEGEVGQSDEEEPKRQKVEDHKDLDFYGLDFDGNDSGNEEDMIFRPLHVPVDAFQDKIQDGRNCHKVSRCDLSLHTTEFCGLPVFELFKVKLILNEERNSSLSGKLYGAIEAQTSCENPDPIVYFSVKKQNAVPIHLTPGNNSISLPLKFPKTKARTILCSWVDVRFGFKFEYENKDEPIDVFEEYGDYALHDHVYYDDGSGSSQAKSLFLSVASRHMYRDSPSTIVTEWLEYPNSDIMRVATRYAMYDGVWATVDVKILKEDIRKYYGFIFARPCIFKSRIRLLSIPEKDQMCELGESKYVVLARQVVAVPTYCSLVIAASLYDQDGEEFARDKTSFKALPPGNNDGKFIAKDAVLIKVKWDCNTSVRTSWLPGAPY